MKRIRLYLINRWRKDVESLFPYRFEKHTIHIVKVKKGKLREWRAYLNGDRLLEEDLLKLGIKFKS